MGKIGDFAGVNKTRKPIDLPLQKFVKLCWGFNDGQRSHFAKFILCGPDSVVWENTKGFTTRMTTKLRTKFSGIE